MNRAENLARTTLQDNCITAYAITRVAFVSALLVQQYLAPATAFCAITPFHVIASSSSASLGKPSARPWPPRRSRFELFGIKRKVKVDLEENFSGKLVDNAGPMSGMMGGGDANALFEVIERNKRRAGEEEEAARNTAEDDEEAEGEEEGREKEVGEFEDHNGGDEEKGA